MKVLAVRTGIYEGKTYKAGDVFEIDDRFFADVHDVDAHHATFGWMERFDENLENELREKQKVAEKKSLEDEAHQKEVAEKQHALLPHQRPGEADRRAKAKLEAEQKAGLSTLVQQPNETNEQYQNRVKAQPTPHVETKDEREKREWLENERKARGESFGQKDQHDAEKKGWA